MEIARVDEKGVIRDDFPDSNAVGLDISHQNHVVTLMREHKPVISEVFRTIEGVDAIALHVPVFRGLNLKGRWKYWLTSGASRSAISMRLRSAKPVTPG